MQQDERDIYLIPPNFIEGGTLLGGMFKTRNVVEAGILAAVIGLPVLNLNLSLTTRIIILCLTALPVVLLALVGISGSSLSAFILQFISYLRNRRILSCEGVSSRSTGKSLLPSWAQKNKSEETENETQLKSRIRLQGAKGHPFQNLSSPGGRKSAAQRPCRLCSYREDREWHHLHTRPSLCEGGRSGSGELPSAKCSGTAKHHLLVHLIPQDRTNQSAIQGSYQKSRH